MEKSDKFVYGVLFTLLVLVLTSPLRAQELSGPQGVKEIQLK